jgi:DNA-binding MarR family transcriptional regulator
MADTMKEQRQAGFLMAKIRQVGERIFMRKLKEYGVEINPAQGRIMFALWQNDDIAINELARKTQLGKSTLTSMLDRLEKAGYIQRVPSLTDRRKTLIRRTQKDRDLEKQYVTLSQNFTKIWYKDFSEYQINNFEKALEKILQNVIDYESEMNS